MESASYFIAFHVFGSIVYCFASAQTRRLIIDANSLLGLGRVNSEARLSYFVIET